MRRPLLGALLAATALTLAACAGPSAPPSTGPTPSASSPAEPASPAASPSPSAADEAPPALSDFVLTSAGIAPIEVGAPVPADAARLVQRTDEDCAEPYWRTNPVYDTDDATWGPGSAFAIGTDAQTDEVRVVEVMSPQIETDTDVHIGTPESDLYPIYPEVKRIAAGESGGASTLWVIDQVGEGSTTSAGILLLEVGADPEHFGDDQQRVTHMRAIMRGIEPFAIAGTDTYWIGGCASE